MNCMIPSRAIGRHGPLAAILLGALLLAAAPWSPAVTPPDDLVVELDVSETPDLEEWGLEAKALVERWYQRIDNLLPTPGFEAPRRVGLVFRESDQGIAHASGGNIVIMSGWIRRRPDDIGLVAHELVHVIQSYPRRAGPGWITEGVADYIRWAIYEAKPLSWFPLPRSRGGQPVERGYESSYQITAGFFLWLESDPAPGIVNRINTAMRQRTYSNDLFEEVTGTSLDDLWVRYMEVRAEMARQEQERRQVAQEAEQAEAEASAASAAEEQTDDAE